MYCVSSIKAALDGLDPIKAQQQSANIIWASGSFWHVTRDEVTRQADGES